jgi:hypothetical protein
MEMKAACKEKARKEAEVRKLEGERRKDARAAEKGAKGSGQNTERSRCLNKEGVQAKVERRGYSQSWRETIVTRQKHVLSSA